MRAQLLIRADGVPGVGSGHLARCLALAEAWVEAKGDITLCSAQPPQRWADRYRELGAALIAPGDDLPPSDWAVVDGYHFDEAALEPVHAAAPRWMAIADHGLGPPGRADLLVDQNEGTDPGVYAARATVRLLGGRHALLRREFRHHAPRRTRVPSGSLRLLVSVGEGRFPAGDAVLHSLESLGAFAGFERMPLVGVDDVPAVMESADVALAAAGSTVWELCFIGVPLVVFAIAGNQVPVAAHLVASGVALGVPAEDPDPRRLAAALTELATDPVKRATLAARGRRLVDGQGAPRVVAALRSVLLTIRPARPDDARLVWEWVNDPAARASAFSSAAVPWDDHLAWFGRRLRSDDTTIFIAETADGRAVGQVRFERHGGIAEIDVAVAPDRRGEGWGAALIRAGCDRFAHTSDGAGRVLARIKPENLASQQAFRFAGFDERQGDAAEAALPPVANVEIGKCRLYALEFDAHHR